MYSCMYVSDVFLKGLPLMLFAQCIAIALGLGPHWDDHISSLDAGCHMPVWESLDYHVVFPVALPIMVSRPSHIIASQDHACIHVWDECK